MQIQLKRAEVISLLTQYIAKQGVDLAGKTVDMKFTGVRKGEGTLVDINIKDMDSTTLSTTLVVADEVPKSTPTLAVVNTTPAAEEAEEAPPQEAPVQQAKSLFG